MRSYRRPEFWLVTVPIRIVRYALLWSQVYWTFIYAAGAIILPTMVLTMLVLWFGFGIRWGW